MSKEEIQKPLISIQCDWDDVIFSQNHEIWISSKERDRDSVHSKLRSHGKKLPVCTCENFTVLSLSHSGIKIKHNPSQHVCTFVPPLKTFSKIHKKKIRSVNVAESGLGVSVCEENRLLVWDLITGDVLKKLAGHVADVYKCKFFPSGIVVLSAGADMQLKIWSAETGDCPVTLIGHKASVNDFCMVERGRNVISVSKDGTAKLWDCGTSTCLDTIFASKDSLNCCCIGILPEELSTGKSEPMNEREFGTNNKLLIIGSEEGFVYAVAVLSRKTIFTIRTDSAVNAVMISGDKVIIGCHSGKIEIYDIGNVKIPHQVYHESNSPVLCGCVYKDNGFFIGKNDGSVLYYGCNKDSDKRISLTGSNFDPIYDMSCVNNKVFTCCRDGKIRQYVLADLTSVIY